MEIDTSGIEPAQLIQTLNVEYGLGITAITFLPKGEEAYSYVADGQAGARHFVRAQPAADSAALEAVFAATSALHAGCGLRSVVAPYPTRRGTFTCQHAGYTVAVFPFIDGTTAYEHGLSDEGVARAAALIAALHMSGNSCDVPLLHRENFANPFEEPILRALRAAADPGPQANAYQQRVHRLLLAEQADIRATLATMRRLQAAAQGLDLAWVPTHGDPNLDNILVDTQGNLHLTDWGEIALGPPERDLFHFQGDHFEVFLRHYLAVVGPVRLHEMLFEFYLYRWAMQEIADYTTRILFRNTDSREDEHAWTELAPYLPIPHTDMQASVREVSAVLQRVAAATTVDPHPETNP